MKYKIGLVIMAGLLATAEAGAAVNRAVSLRVLESVVKTGPSKEASRLCGITKVTGYVVDRKSRDVILTGEVDPTEPQLRLDDFVVALRNVNLSYARRSGNTYYYAAPGCSIDPNPDTLRELQRVADSISNSTNDEERKQRIDEWNVVGRGSQNVRVLGVPFYTRFARVMVDADYYMKRLVNGSVDLEIDGFTSMMGMDVQRTKNAMNRGDFQDAQSNSLNRFWFCPGETTYEEDGGAVTLRTCRVKLLTESEFLSISGHVKGRGRSEPLAQHFADSFTVHYDQIAAARPIYKELRGLFRFVALARLMRDEKSLASSRLDLSYLINQHKVATAPVPTAVSGLTRCEEISETRQVEGGMVAMRSMQVSCGGVSMDVRPKRIKPVAVKASSTVASRTPRTGSTKASSLKAQPKRATSTPKHKALAARTSPKALYWDFPKKD